MVKQRMPLDSFHKEVSVLRNLYRTSLQARVNSQMILWFISQIKWYYLDIRPSRYPPIRFEIWASFYALYLYIMQDWLFFSSQSQTWTYCTYWFMLQAIRQDLCLFVSHFDLQYLTLDQISMYSHWSGLLSFGVSIALVKVKRHVPYLWLAKQKQPAIFAILMIVIK